MGNIAKVGYFRIVKGSDERFLNFAEFSAWEDVKKEKLRMMQSKGIVSLYCGCCAENTLELAITKNHVLRVAHNKMQQEHMLSCPKSITYASWLSKQLPGAGLAEECAQEDVKVSFRIALPSIVPSVSSGGGSQSVKTDDVQHRAKLLDMIRFINFSAWEKQNFSIKKKIRQFREMGDSTPWQYKNRDDFLRLFFGITNDIYVEVQKELLPFYELCYKRKIFYESANDYRFFMNAEIIKVSEFKEDRKYQYITVKMPSNVSKDKAVIRIPTKLFCAMQEELEKKFDGTVKMLSGYIYHAVYNTQSENDTAQWITMLKGVVYHVMDNTGLYVENEQELEVITQLVNSRQLFVRPYNSLENYGNMFPTAVVERLSGKNIIIDCVSGTREYNKRAVFAEDNPEYEVVLFKETEIPDITSFLK